MCFLVFCKDTQKEMQLGCKVAMPPHLFADAPSQRCRRALESARAMMF
jgi:hypothetical protein